MAQNREFNYTLTTTKVAAAKPREKPYPLTDGGGLFLEVLPTGAKTWRYSYLFGGKRRKVTIGPYPAISIPEARDKHAELRKVLVNGADPARKKQQDKAEAAAVAARADDFESFARVWVKETLFHRSEHTRKLTVGWLERDVFPRIGALPLGDVRPADVLAIVESLREVPSTANRVRAILQQIFNYGIRKLLLTANPAIAVRGTVVQPPVKHYRPLTPQEVPVFLNALDACGAHPGTKLAVKLAMLAVVQGQRGKGPVGAFRPGGGRVDHSGPWCRGRRAHEDGAPAPGVFVAPGAGGGQGGEGAVRGFALAVPLDFQGWPAHGRADH